jgi:single-stranded-DNA-specific exonuclease
MKSILNYNLNKKNFIQDLLQYKNIQDIDLFLYPNEKCEEDIYHLNNIAIGLFNLNSWLQHNLKLNIIVDDDADGFLSCALIYFFLQNINYPQDKYNFIFHSHKFHGIDLNELDEDCQIVIAPDCGTSDYEQHNQLEEKNIYILILDHHEAINGISTSDNVTTINNQLSILYNNKYLCGAGVTFKFLKEYCKQYHPNINMNKYLDLVAIAIVGDVMNLSTLENRYYVSEGLQNIQNPFFKALVEKRAFSIGSNIPTPTDVAFYLIPAINAIVRMGTKEEKELLFHAITNGNIIVPSTKRGHAPDDTEVLKEQAIRLCDNAIARQRRERTKIAELLTTRIYENGWENDKIIIGKYYDKDKINPNLTGLAAMELATQFQRPALVIHYNEEDDSWSGSARGFGSAILDLRQFFLDSELLNYAAGHSQAHGISIQNSNLDKFREYCNTKLININYTSDNVYEVDLETTIDDPWLIPIITQIDKYKNMWGKGIEEPLICIKNIELYHKDIITMGTNADSVKFIKGGIAFVKFKDLEFYDKLMIAEEPIYLTIVGKANMNFWNGHSTPQLFIQDYNIENIYDF